MSKSASPGDVIALSGAQTLTADCVWTVPGVVIRGEAGTSRLVAAGQKEQSLRLIITAPGVTLEGIRIEGISVEVHAANFAMRSVEITGAPTGLSVDAGEGSVHIENSVFRANVTDVAIGEVETLSISGSTLASAGGVTTRARHNIIHGNRFTVEHEAGIRALLVADSSSTSIENNVFSAVTPAEAVFVSSLSERNGEQTLSIRRNTFVSRAGNGTLFVEALGAAEPALEAQGNVFWGNGAFKAAGEQVLRADSYAGDEEIFSDEAAFLINPASAAGDRGAVPAAPPAEVAAVAAIAAPESDASNSEKEAVRASAATTFVSSIGLQSTSVSGSAFLFTNRVNLNAPVPSGSVTVSITSSNPAVVQPLSSSVMVFAGQSSGLFPLRTFVPATSTNVVISATVNGVTTKAVMTVGPTSLKSVVLQEDRLGSNATTLLNRVYFSGPASGSSQVVTLRSSSPLVQVPSSVIVPVGVDNGAFTITTGVVSVPVVATITASHSTGSVSQTIVVTPSGLSGALVAPVMVAGGATPLLKLYLNGPAPAGGLVLKLTSSDPSVAALPSTAIVPAGMVEVSVPCRTSAVSYIRAVTLTATDGNTARSAVLSVTPVSVSYLYGASSILSGRTSVLYVLLTGPAPAGGLTVSAWGSSGVLSVPARVTIPAGASLGVLSVSAGWTASPTTVTVTVAAGGSSRSKNVTVGR